MTPLKMLRKIGKIIRGGATPPQMFLGCLLGVMIGMTPGFNLTLLILILLFILLNANTALAILGFAIGKILCVALAPITFRIGYFVVHDLGLEGLFRTLFNTPVIALMDLHVYSLLGGIPIAIVVGLIYAAIIIKLVIGIRRGIVSAQGKSTKFAALGNNPLVRFFMRLVFGKRKATSGEAMEKKAPPIRKGGIVIVIILALLVVGAEFIFAGYFFKNIFVGGLQRAIGAEVNVDDVKLSLIGGSLSVQGLQVTDPDKPTHNMFQVQNATGDVSMRDVLTKRFVIALLKADTVRTDVERESPGKVFPKYREEVEEEPTTREIDEKDLTRYFEKAKQYRRYLRKLKEYLENRRDAKKQETDPEARERRVKDLAKQKGYLRLSAADLLARKPRWTIRKLEVDGIRLSEEKRVLDMRGMNLADKPELLEKPMAMTITDNEGLMGQVIFTFNDLESPNSLKLNIPDIPVGQAVQLSEDAPISVREGTATLNADGVFDADAMNVRFTIPLRGLQASSQGGEGLLGMDPKTSTEVMKSLQELTVYGSVVGDTGSPTLQIDREKTLAALQDALKKAGKAELARRANEQLEKVREEVTGELEEKTGIKLPDLKSDRKSTTRGILEGVLGGDKKKDSQDKDAQDSSEDEDEESDAEKIIKDLF